MTTAKRAFTGARIFDGRQMLDDRTLVAFDDETTQIADKDVVPDTCPLTSLEGGIITPGFIDLQVNGGGGVMFNDDPSLETLITMATAHHGLGTAGFLPTLITDTPAKTRAAIAAASTALAQKLAGIIGLHLEGPHLSAARKGAHDGALVRPMTAEDETVLLAAADEIANLMITVAPENVTPAQIATLSQAGIVVSIGHSDCDYDTAMRAFDAGARAATHLFNAMSQPSARAPGVVGAVLDHDRVACGLIADGVHVHPAMIRMALSAKPGQARIFLVSDAMATAGADITRFTLNGRTILRDGGRLTLADGTLAGADLTLPEAIGFMVDVVGDPLDAALSRATTIPAALLRDAPKMNTAATMLWLSDDLTTQRWLSDL